MSTTELTYSGPSMPSSTEVATLSQLANHMSKSGFFKAGNEQLGAYQTLAKLVFGRDLGLSATAALTGIHIVEGKPEISANVQAQMVKTYVGPEGERYDYKVDQMTTEACAITFLRRRRGDEWEVLGQSTYSMADARTAGLDQKAVWRKHPRNMLFARCVSDGVAFYCPEVTNGIRVYSEGEIDVNRDHAPAPVKVESAVAEPQSSASTASAEVQSESEPEIPDAEVVDEDDYESESAEDVPVEKPAAAEVADPRSTQVGQIPAAELDDASVNELLQEIANANPTNTQIREGLSKVGAPLIPVKVVESRQGKPPLVFPAALKALSGEQALQLATWLGDLNQPTTTEGNDSA